MKDSQDVRQPKFVKERLECSTPPREEAALPAALPSGAARFCTEVQQLQRQEAKSASFRSREDTTSATAGFRQLAPRTNLSEAQDWIGSALHSWPQLPHASRQRHARRPPSPKCPRTKRCTVRPCRVCAAGERRTADDTQ